MIKQLSIFLNFNRGLVSDLGLARQDIERISLSAVLQNNFITRVLGVLMLRPGTQYVNQVYNNNKPFHIGFVYDDQDTDDVALIEVTDQNFRVLVSDSLISRSSVSSSVTNGDFSSSISGWTSADDAGATSSWDTGGYLSLVGSLYSEARAYQLVSVAPLDQNVAHGIRIIIERGEVVLDIGSSVGGGEYVYQRILGKGEHSLEITPTGDFHIQFSANKKYASLVDSCVIESSGDVVVNSPWLEADLGNLRYDQSGDVIYIACRGYQEKKIIRYDQRSWSLVDFEPNNGPFNIINTTGTTLTPSALSGDITLTSSQNLFTSDSVGQLYRIHSIGQKVEVSANGAGQWSDSIRVSGVGEGRRFSFVISGTWAGTVTIQQSIGDEGAWTDYATYISNISSTVDGGLDNQIVYYRIGIDTGDYTSGSAECSFTYSSGSISGIVRITGYTGEKIVSAMVLQDLGQTTASSDWSAGAWSVTEGFPTALVLHDGRLTHGGNGKLYFSASDAYEDYDGTVEGNAAAFTKNIPKGARVVKWMLSLKRLMFGTKSHEWFAMSNSYDEAVTLSNSNIKSPSNQGSSSVSAVEYDGAGLFVQKSGIRLFQSSYKVEADDYKPDDLSKIIPEFLLSGVVRIAIQRQPDTRVHVVLGDGTVMILVLDELEDVKGWFSYSTDGSVEDVVILPGDSEDAVYYSVARTVGGNTVRYLEKWAQEAECQGGNLNKQADSFTVYQGSPTSTITGLSHLEGKDVVVWGDGVDLSPDDSTGVQQTYTVSGGQITLFTAVSNAVVGLPYTAQYKSAKLLLQSRMGTLLLQKKNIINIGFTLKNTLKSALKYGQDFTDMYDLPDVEGGSIVADSNLYETYDEEMFDFGGEYDTDPRICLEVKSPRPCTILACIAGVVANETNDR